VKILVTGGSGFVGGALCARSIARGWNTLSIARRPARCGPSFNLDLTQPFELDFRPDVVVHAAARSSPWGKAEEFTGQTVDSTRHVIAFCEQVGRPHLIYVSTAAVLYEKRHQYNLAEDAPLPAEFINDYARSKFAAEELVRLYPGPQTIVRPRAVFGPADTVVFPRILSAAKKGKFPLIESDEVVMADLIYIDTLADYLVRIIELRAIGLYHLTNQQPVALLSFLLDVFARLQLPVPRRKVKASRAMAAAHLLESVHRLLPFLGEPPLTRFGVSVFAYSKTLDASKSLRDLGPPSVSVDEGVQRFVDWQRS
jgi:nucleoside-diphosphate-sugar epimerase